MCSGPGHLEVVGASSAGLATRSFKWQGVDDAKLDERLPTHAASGLEQARRAVIGTKLVFTQVLGIGAQPGRVS